MSTVKIEGNAGGSGTFTIASPNSNNTRTLTLPDEAGTILASGGALGTPSSGTVTNLTGTASININGTVGATTASTGAFTTLTTSSTVTHNGGTANGVAFLNASKVLTTGSALTFDGGKLAVSGAGLNGADDRILTVTNTTANSYGAMTLVGTSRGGYLNFYNGATAQASILGQASALSFYVGTDSSGSQSMILNSTGLGIGTSSPATKLDVSGGASAGLVSVRTTSATAGAAVNLIGSSSTYKNWQISAGLAAVFGALEFTPSNAAGGSTFVTPAMLIDSSGNVGIGTTSPQGPLDVAASGATVNQFLTGGVGNNAVTGVFRIGSGIGRGASIQGFRGGSSNIHSLDFYTYNAADVFAMRIDSAGSVGIGTSSPVARNHIRGSGTSGQVTASWMLENASSGTAGMDITGTAGASRWRYLYGTGPSTGTNTLTEAMCILTEGASAGNVGIGTSSPSYKLDVTGNIGIDNSANSATANFFNTNAGLTTQVIQSIAVKAAGTDFTLFRGVSGSSTTVFNVFGNGNVTNTNNSYGAISDVKLKENIVDASPKLLDLMQVKVRNYNLKTNPDQKQIGVIAQELAIVFPSMVDESIDQDEDGNALETTTKSVKYSVFVPMLIKAIQEQQALITALTARITALESN